MIFKERRKLNIMKTFFRGKNLYKTLLLVFLIVITAFRIFYSQSIELFFDEAYYWDWARHLDLSYLDQPPLVAYLIAASTKIFGNTEMAIRLPAVIFSAATSIVIFFFARTMFRSEKYALISVFLLNLILLFNVDSVLMLPDTLLIFFWVLTLYLFYLAIRINPRYWYLAGLSLGLALLSKCIGVLLIPVIGLTLLLIQENRRWLSRKEVYLSFFIALMIFSPVIYWNITHDFLSFRFQLGHGLNNDGIPLYSLGNFIVTQPLILSPPVSLIIFASIFITGFISLRKRDDRFLLLFLSGFVPIVFFGLISIKSRIEPYWAIEAYPAMVISIPIICRWLIQKNGFFLKKMVKPSLLSLGALSLMLNISAFATPGNSFLTSIPISKELVAKVYGWKELGAKISELADDETKILASDYHIAGELGFYMPGHPQVYAFNPDGRLSQYNLWFDAKKFKNKKVLFVAPKSKDTEGFLAKNFKSFKKIKDLTIGKKSMILKEYSVYQVKLKLKTSLEKNKREWLIRWN